MIKLIINADDLGINPIVNAKIEQFIKEGMISSSTIIAMGAVFDDAVRIAKENPQISFGVHLCLDEFESLTHSKALCECGITDNDGCFIKTGIYSLKKINRIAYQAIYGELYAQVKRVSDAGVKISHFDSHHHFLTERLELLDIIKKIADEFQIKKIRRSPSHILKIRSANKKFNLNDFTKVSQKNINQPYKSFIKRLNNIVRLLIKKKIWTYRVSKEFMITDGLYSYYYLYNLIDIFRASIKNKTIETMCHPGHPSYLIESDLVMDKILNRKIDYQLISYNEL